MEHEKLTALIIGRTMKVHHVLGTGFEFISLTGLTGFTGLLFYGT